MLSILAWTAGVSAAIYTTALLFLLLGMLRLRRPKVAQQPEVSIVVAARNEAKNLPKCLAALSAQTYPGPLTEIIVVNNLSQDDSAAVLETWRQKLARLTIMQLDDIPLGISPKKHALSCGIAEASGSLIVTTDADCSPPPRWLETMISHFSAETGLLAGPAPLEPQGWLGGVLALDSVASMAVAAGGCGWNTAITCTGRNLAYRKQVFDLVGGFGETGASLSGDDDLLMQRVRRNSAARVDFALSPEAVVPSQSVRTLREYFRQRRRHVSAGKYYTPRLKFAYLTVNICNAVLFVFPATALGSGVNVSLAFTLLGVKLTCDLAVLALAAARIGKSRLLFYFPLWQLFFIISQILVAPLGFAGRVRW